MAWTHPSTTNYGTWCCTMYICTFINPTATICDFYFPMDAALGDLVVTPGKSLLLVFAREKFHKIPILQ